MKKSKTRKVASAILACAAVLSLGIASGCGGCNGDKHNWDWDYDANGHWQYCTDDGCEEKTEKAPHVDETGDEKCDVCGASVHNHSYTEWVKTDPTQHWKICEADGAIDESSRENHDFTNGDCKCGRANPNGGEEEYTETATIHFHKPADFGDKVYAHAYFHDSESDSDKNLTGAWKSYEVTATDADGWYTIEVKHPDNLFDDGSFNLMIIPEEGENISVTITVAETWVNTNGNLFATKAEAVADEAVEKVEYAIYYYAPDWAEDETVYVYTYGGPSVGEYNTVMPADGEDGWYKITFKTTLELTTFHVMFHTQDDETVKRDLVVTATETLLEGKAFYLIDNGDGVYATKAEAEEAYANQPEEPEYTETATIHFHKPEDFGDRVYAHAYYNDGTSDKNLTGAWMSYEVTTVADGWYTIEVKHPDNLLEDGSFNLMIIPETGDSISVTITASEMWVNANGNLFATKAEAEADEEAEATEYAIYYYAPDWATGETVYVYTYGGPSVGEYNTVMPADGNGGWYKITFETTLELTTFHVMFHTEDDTTVKRDLAVTATEALLEGKAFYFIDNGTAVYDSKADAEAAYEENAQPVDPSTKNEYTVYLYAPEAASGTAITVSVWGGMAGAFNDGSAMTAVADHSGWYSFTFKTDKEIADGANFNYYVGEVSTPTTSGYTTDANWVYFISNKTDMKYNSMEAAEAAYAEGVHTHTYSDWQTNGEKHWKEANCGDLSEGDEGYITEEGAHVKGANEKCVTCGYDMHVHTYDMENWSTTSAQHYHAATCDDLKDDTTNPLYKKDADGHEYEDGKCKVCDYPEPQAPHTHTFETEWTAKGADGHYHKPTCDDLTTADEEYYNGLTDGHVDEDEDEVCDDCEYDMHVHTIGMDKDATGHWDIYTCGHELAKDVKAHEDSVVDEKHDGVCKVCGYAIATEVTINVHAKASWTTVNTHLYYNDKPFNTVGDWPGASLSDSDNDGWFTVTVKIPNEAFAAGYNIIVNGTGEQYNVTGNTANLAELWISKNGKTFDTKVKALADEDSEAPRAYSYTFYMYAPEASNVTIGVWGSFEGEIADGTPMTAVSGHDGWYSYTLNTDIQIKAGNGINLNIFVDGANKGKYSENETDLYFIPVGNDRGFTSFEAAEAKYEELTNVDPNTTISMTIHFQKPTAWGNDLGAYIYGDVGELLGGFWDTTMTYADGWYTVNVSEIQNGATFSLIIYDKSNADPNRIEKPFTATENLYIGADGNVTTAPNS